MNCIAKNLIIYSIGALCGSISTFIFIKKKYETIANDEIDQMQEYYETKAPTYEQLVEQGRIIVEEDGEPEAPKEYRHAPKEMDYDVKRKGAQRKNKIDYTSFYKESDNDEPNEAHYEDLTSRGESLTRERNMSKGPKLIKAEDFGSEPNLDTVTLCYYTEDNVLTVEEDQNEEILEDLDEIGDMIGDALTKFGFVDNDEEVIYIRNQKRGCDYEVVKMFSSFYDPDSE